MTSIASYGITKTGVDEYKIKHNSIYELLLLGLTRDDIMWESDDDHIVIHTPYIRTLKQFIAQHISGAGEGDGIGYLMAEKMMLDLGAQFTTLTHMNMGVLFFGIDDIIVIGNDIFMIANLDNIIPLNKNKDLVLMHPATFYGLLPPELENITSLPFITNISSAYYSASIVCIQSMNIDKTMDRIYGSKLYFFLKRCLVIDPAERYFIFI